MSNSEQFSLSEILQIAIPVQDIAKAVAFYRDVLSIQFLFEAPPQLAFFQCGSVRLMLSVSEQPEFDHHSSVIYFSVPDLEEAHRTLLERGVTFEGEPHIVHKDDRHELWMGFFRDPSSNLLAVTSVKML